MATGQRRSEQGVADGAGADRVCNETETRSTEGGPEHQTAIDFGEHLDGLRADLSRAIEDELNCRRAEKWDDQDEAMKLIRALRRQIAIAETWDL